MAVTTTVTRTQRGLLPSTFRFLPFIPKLLLLVTLCSLSYLLGSHVSSKLDHPQSRIPIFDCPTITAEAATANTTTVTDFKQLDFQPYHFAPTPAPSLGSPSTSLLKFKLPFCHKSFSNYCPCQNPLSTKFFSTDRFFHRERHCPSVNSSLRCLIPRPEGYRRTFPWPKSKAVAWFSNVPSKRLTITKKKQNWVRLEGDRLIFPGGGTSFPSGVKGYVNQIARVLPLKSGRIRTALDVGCGVASFGAAMWEYNIITMSIAPQDIHESQVQFALERGLPAMLGILSTYRLPYASRSFDMAHCSRCLVQWTNYGGLYMLELDRVLRPGGYWVLSGPPINWKLNYKGWKTTARDLEEEQMRLEDLLKRLCWKKVHENGNIAVWRKPTNHLHCEKKLKAWKSLQLCDDRLPDFAWYRKMDTCITRLPNVTHVDDPSGGYIEKWPRRLNSIPPRIKNRAVKGITSTSFAKDSVLWKGRITHYGRVLDTLFKGGYRNVMDMNAGLGGFAAALSRCPVWVMNAVPHDAKKDTLGVIYERGLIGTYMNWCEAFSTYPRTYDLIHADGVFSFYMNKCDALDIVLEMYRILRPEGAVIVRDHADVIVKVKGIMERVGWSASLSHSEKGPFHPEKVLFIDNRKVSGQ